MCHLSEKLYTRFIFIYYIIEAFSMILKKSILKSNQMKSNI